MATKYYGINDKWTNDDIENVIEVTSEDGSVNSVKVNGEEYGGGGGGGMFTTAVLTSTAAHSVTVPHVQSFDGIYTIGSDTVTTPGTDLTIVLTNGTCLLMTDATVTGSAEVLDPDEGTYKVTGNVNIA